MKITIGAEWRPVTHNKYVYVAQDDSILGHVQYFPQGSTWLGYVERIGSCPITSDQSYTLVEAQEQVELFVHEETN